MARLLDRVIVIDVEALGLPLEGIHHRAGDDAANIARILAALLRAGKGVAATS